MLIKNSRAKQRNGNNDDEVESTSLGPGDMPTDRWVTLLGRYKLYFLISMFSSLIYSLYT